MWQILVFFLDPDTYKSLKNLFHCSWALVACVADVGRSSTYKSHLVELSHKAICCRITWHNDGKAFYRMLAQDADPCKVTSETSAVLSIGSPLSGIFNMFLTVP